MIKGEVFISVGTIIDLCTCPNVSAVVHTTHLPEVIMNVLMSQQSGDAAVACTLSTARRSCVVLIVAELCSCKSTDLRDIFTKHSTLHLARYC